MQPRHFSEASIATMEARSRLLASHGWAMHDLRAEYVCSKEARDDMATLDAMATLIVQTVAALDAMASTIANGPAADTPHTRALVVEAYTEAMLHPAAARYLVAAVEVAR